MNELDRVTINGLWSGTASSQMRFAGFVVADTALVALMVFYYSPLFYCV